MDVYSELEWGTIHARLVHAEFDGEPLLVVERWKENPRFGNSRVEVPPVVLAWNAASGKWSEASRTPSAGDR